jgi:hypothetical protein
VADGAGEACELQPAPKVAIVASVRGLLRRDANLPLRAPGSRSSRPPPTASAGACKPMRRPPGPPTPWCPMVRVSWSSRRPAHCETSRANRSSSAVTPKGDSSCGAPQTATANRGGSPPADNRSRRPARPTLHVRARRWPCSRSPGEKLEHGPKRGAFLGRAEVLALLVDPHSCAVACRECRFGEATTLARSQFERCNAFVPPSSCRPPRSIANITGHMTRVAALVTRKSPTTIE